jgi:hypothetical protein
VSDSVYVHKLEDGRTVKLPSFDQIPFGVIRKLRKADNDGEAFFGLIEQVADADALEVLDSLPLAATGEVFSAWQSHAGVTAGESSASPDS